MLKLKKNLKRNIPRIISVLMLVVIFTLFTTVAFAVGETATEGGEFGENAYNWLQAQVQWIALLVVAIICVPFIMKKMWMQLAGFLVLAAIVLFIISDPSKLSALGSTIWTKLIG